MTVEEFRDLPEPAGDFVYELHLGELVQVSRPKVKHHIARDKICDLLKPLLRHAGHVGIELPFRVFPEHDLRAADVGFVSHGRWLLAVEEDDVSGTPDLVIEVLSPSNTAAEMYGREQLCLANRCSQFWTVDLTRKRIRVATSDAPPRFYQGDDEILLHAFGGSSLRAGDVFSQTN